MSASFTPGWNDPPKFGTEQTVASSGATRSMFNKRIAFPLQPQSAAVTNGSSAPSMMQAENPIAPVAVNTFMPQVAPSNVQTSAIAADPTAPVIQNDAAGSSVDPCSESVTLANANNTEIASTSLDEKEIVAVLSTALDRCSMQESQKQNVRRRLEKLEVSLSENKLSPVCRQKLDKLINGVKIGGLNEAYSVHSAMVIDHYTEVNAWMVAVKAIILDLQKSSAS